MDIDQNDMDGEEAVEDTDAFFEAENEQDQKPVVFVSTITGQYSTVLSLYSGCKLVMSCKDRRFLVPQLEVFSWSGLLACTLENDNNNGRMILAASAITN